MNRDPLVEKEVALGSALRSARTHPGLSIVEIAELIRKNVGDADSSVLAEHLTDKTHE